MDDRRLENIDVDVVIPTIGRESLRRAVESVNNQTLNARAIVVLDVPERYDDVQSLLEGLNFTLLMTAGQARAAVARNLGLERVEAAHVAFLDDDDWWGHQRLERLFACIPPNSVGDDLLIGSRFHFVLPDGSSRIIPENRPLPSADPGWMPSYLIRRTGLKFGEAAMQTSTLLISSDLAKRTKWRGDLKKHQDWDFITRLLESSEVKFYWADDNSCFVQKDSPGSISKRMDWQSSLDWVESVDNKNHLDRRSMSDFLWVHVLRAALAQRSLKGIGQFVLASPLMPHPASVVLGVSGAAQLLGFKR